MAENNITATQTGGTNNFKEAVCIEAGRIFDACSDKDCLEDLQVFFTTEGQAVIDASTLIKCKSAEVMDVYLTVEPMPFNKGFYTVDITFYFRIQFAAYASPVATPTDVTGLAYFCKKVILFGGEGGAKTFRSDDIPGETRVYNKLPVATLKAVEPICLGSRIVDTAPCYGESIGTIPDEVGGGFDGPIVADPTGDKVALVTLGLFTIVTLERDMQMMVPAYDYCIPEKDCMTSMTAEDPCEVFKRIKFPVEAFFPEDLGGDAPGGCNSVSVEDFQG